MIRPLLASALAGALWLGGWLGGMLLAGRLASGPFAAAMLAAGWLFALHLAGRAAAHRRSAAHARALLLAGGAVAIGSLLAIAGGAGPAPLWPALAATALLQALAAGIARAAPAPAGRPAAGAIAVGAGFAVLAAGDTGEPLRLALGLALVLPLLVALVPAHGLGGTEAPDDRRGAHRPPPPSGSAWNPARWLLRIAALAMLPMMLALPQMLSLCRADGLPPALLPAAHLAAMALPALLWPRHGNTERRSAACALLLIVGGLATLLALPQAALVAMLAQGAAFGLACGAPPGAAEGCTTLPGARAPLMPALCLLATGALFALAGPAALAGVQAALSLAGAVALVALVRRPRPAAPTAGRSAVARPLTSA